MELGTRWDENTEKFYLELNWNRREWDTTIMAFMEVSLNKLLKNHFWKVNTIEQVWKTYIEVNFKVKPCGIYRFNRTNVVIEESGHF